VSKNSQTYSLDSIFWGQLVPTHNKLRSPSSVGYFDSFFKRNVIPERDRPALLIQTEDDVIYIHDGHHYLRSALKNLIPLRNLDVKIQQYTYADLNDINFSVGYVTPYNPKRYVRRHVLPEFKAYIMKLKEIDESEAVGAILANTNYYTEWRKVNSLVEL
jgi:hypothetical protein